MILLIVLLLLISMYENMIDSCIKINNNIDHIFKYFYLIFFIILRGRSYYYLSLSLYLDYLIL
jgi:hypothetical protein